MKNYLLCFSAAFLLLSSCDNKQENKTETVNDSTLATTATGDTIAMTTETTTTPASPMDTADMMKNWEAYMTPGSIHKMMADWGGTWTQEVTLWQTPGAPPQTSTSKSVNRMLMGGRYMQSTSTGTMMGQPFEGISTLAYDNATKQFINTWIDNVGTGMMILKGTWDEATKTINLSGDMVDPSSAQGNAVPVREALHIIDENTHVMEMFGPSNDGKVFKMMEIKMTRK